MMQYLDFLRSKQRKVEASGFEKPRDTMNPLAFGWQKDIVFWALKKGRAALFEDCGLGKTLAAAGMGAECMRSYRAARSHCRAAGSGRTDKKRRREVWL